MRTNNLGVCVIKKALLFSICLGTNVVTADVADKFFPKFEYKKGEINSRDDDNNKGIEIQDSYGKEMYDAKKEIYKKNLDKLNKELADKEIATGKYSTKEEEKYLNDIKRLNDEIEQLKRLNEDLESNRLRSSNYLNFNKNKEDKPNKKNEDNSPAFTYGY